MPFGLAWSGAGAACAIPYSDFARPANRAFTGAHRFVKGAVIASYVFGKPVPMSYEDAIKRMLPKSKLGRQMISKLKIYRGDKHPHEAQKPETRKLAVRA